MPVTVRKTLEQGRAEFAYRCVEQVLNLKAFGFDSVNINTHRKILNWLDRKLGDKYKDSPIYKEFIKGPRNKAEEYKKSLDGLRNKGKDPESELKGIILKYYEQYGKDYKSYAKKIPMLIKNNGLGATLAFIFSKAKDGNAYELLYRQIEKWLDGSKWKFNSSPNGENLVAWIISLPSTDYRAVTIEVLAFLNWLKRFVDGLIEGEDEGDGDNE